jgi:hypothetical protein
VNKYKYILLGNIKVLFIIFIFISLFIFFIFPYEVFAMEPPHDCTNVYAFCHPDPATDIDAIQSKVSPSYGTQPLFKED